VPLRCLVRDRRSSSCFRPPERLDGELHHVERSVWLSSWCAQGAGRDFWARGTIHHHRIQNASLRARAFVVRVGARQRSPSQGGRCGRVSCVPVTKSGGLGWCVRRRERERQCSAARRTERSVVPPPSRHRRYLADPTAGNHPPINSFTASGLSWLIQCEQRPNK
jgi:hypothetical protein